MRLARLLCSAFRFGAAALFAASCVAAPNASPQGAEWRVLGGGSDQWYYSPLPQINKSNVRSLGLAWYADMETGNGLVGNPLVAEGVIYQGGPPGKVYANDLKTGKALWTYKPEFQYAENTSWTGFWGTHVNRGLALDEDHLYIGAYCRLQAVSRSTGKLVWSSQSCDPIKRQAITGAPRVGGGKVFIGNASGDFGGDRGHVDAFDAKTGKHLWRFHTMPGDPAQPHESKIMAEAAKTWGTDYWKYTQGGVSPWDAITYDEKSDTLFFGTDGPSPWSPAQRAPDAGDELFTDSIIAVDATTGEYKWHFQTVQKDGWNLAATMHIMLADLPIRGGLKRVVMTAPKNGFFYVLDAATGKFIDAKNYVPVNWTKGLNPETGRPIPSSEAAYWERPGKVVIPLPGDVGGHNWQAMAFHPGHKTVYIPATIVPVPTSVDKEGEVSLDYYYGMRPEAKVKMRGELVAWDPVLQRAKWRAPRSLPINGGVLATAGDLVFQGTGDGKFEAFDAGSGKKLWSFDAGGAIIAAPTTVTVDGEQFLIVASGNGGSSGMRGIPRLMSNLKSQGPARLLAFRLGGTTPLPIQPPPPFPKPEFGKPDAGMAERGRLVFIRNACGACHGHEAKGTYPGLPADLRRSDKLGLPTLKAIVVDGAFKAMGMPAHPDISEKDLSAMQAFILKEAWRAYEGNSSSRNAESKQQ